MWFEYMIDTARQARAKNIKNVWVTCGYIQPEPLVELCQVLDGVHIDLKGFSDETYQRLNSGKLAPVLATIKTLRREKVWFEVINLIVPTYTDDPATIRRDVPLAGGQRGAGLPRAFLPLHAGPQTDAASQHALGSARRGPVDRPRRRASLPLHRQLRRGARRETTLCCHCGKAVIKRAGFSVQEMNVEQGKCKFCRTAIAGVWA